MDDEAIRQRTRREWGARAGRFGETMAAQTARIAEVLVDAVGIEPGERVLDVATGPGTVAVVAARVVGPTGRVLATDLVPEWAPHVAERAAAAGVANVEFREMGAEALDLPDEAFDVALCQLGLMLVPDPRRALGEMRRVLRSGGRLGVVVWSTLDKVALFRLGRQSLGQLAPQQGEAGPGPLRLGEPGLVEGHVAAAGFRDARVERRTIEFEAGAPEEVWRLRAEEGPPPLRAAIAALDPAERERVRAAFLAEAESYRRGEQVVLPNEFILVTARR